MAQNVSDVIKANKDAFAKEVVEEVKALKAQRRGPKVIVEKMAKKGVTLTEADVKSILGGDAKPAEEAAKKADKPAKTAKKVVDTVDAGGGILVDVVETAKEEPKTEETGKSLYKCVGPKIKLFALLTPEQVTVRNKARKDGLTWEPATADEVPQGVGVEDGDMRTLTAKEEAEGTGKKPAKKAKAEGGEEKPAKREAPVRESWNGVGMCAFLRYLGNKYPKLEKAVYLDVATQAGFDPDGTTVKIQTAKGRRNDNVPELEKGLPGQIKEMVAKAKEAVAEKEGAEADAD